MTHKDIYTKFMIEYDKANVTSSYPSLTEYEAATILDKAYLALIGQKITGNNYRRAGLETDIKAASDLAPLIVTAHSINASQDDVGDNELGLYTNPEDGFWDSLRDKPIRNEAICTLPKDFLYYVSATATTEYIGRTGSAVTNVYTANLVGHTQAEKFYETSTNIPWINGVVVYLDKARLPESQSTKQANVMWILYDRYIYQGNVVIKQSVSKASLTYIKTPLSFDGFSENTNFECNDAVAEELISLAVAFALENVESQRLNSKLITRRLEV